MKRSPIFVIGFLVVLAGIVFLLLPSGEREASERQPAVSVKIDSASTVKIELRRPSRTIVLDNVGGRWTITSPGHYSADPVIINKLISDISRLTVGSLISSNPEKQHLFQVDSTGTFVTVGDRSGKSVSFIVGKMGPSFSEVYFRMPEANNVYLAEGIDSWSVNREVRDWRDKTILMAPNETVKELSYSIGGKQFLFHRDSSGWKAGDRTIEPSDINPPLTTLASLKADDFLDDGVTEKSAPITLGVHWLENTTLMLYPRLPDSSKYVVQSSASSQLFVINKWTAQQLLKPVQQPGPSASPARVTAAQFKAPAPVAANPVPKKAPPVTVKPEPRKTVTAKPSPADGAKREPVTKPVQNPVTESKPLQQQKVPPPVQIKTEPPPVKEVPKEKPPVQTPPAKANPAPQPVSPTADTDGDLQVHTVLRGETMQTIAKKYNVSVEQILKWNLLKSIVTKPGQELYIYTKSK
jgi:LysM repeat protein